LHLVGILFPHINDDARSKSQQIWVRIHKPKDAADEQDKPVQIMCLILLRIKMRDFVRRDVPSYRCETLTLRHRGDWSSHFSGTIATVVLCSFLGGPWYWTMVRPPPVTAQIEGNNGTSTALLVRCTMFRELNISWGRHEKYVENFGC